MRSSRSEAETRIPVSTGRVPEPDAESEITVPAEAFVATALKVAGRPRGHTCVAHRVAPERSSPAIVCPVTRGGRLDAISCVITVAALEIGTGMSGA